jgi:prepilin signal peptidase PulO-like enzyme (type II secretory pathway)
MQEVDQIYQRVSFTLVLLSLLGGVIFKLARVDIINLTFARLDVFFYYLAVLSAILLLGIGILFAVLFTLPRKKQYKTIASMDLWQKWRTDYENELNELNEKNDDTVDEAMIVEITKKFVEAQATNAPINEKRRQYFYKSVLMASLCFIPIVVQATFYLFLKIQGV